MKFIYLSLIDFKTFLNVFCFLNIIFVQNSSANIGWFKVCRTEEKYQVTTDVCHKGIFLDEPISPGCICVQGVWVLSAAFCDEDVTIVVGNGDCFHITHQVQMIKLIGKANDPFAPSTYTGPKELDTFIQISGGEYSPKINADKTIVIGINPNKSLVRYDQLVCLEVSSVKRNKAVHIYLNRRRQSNQWKTMYNGNCEAPQDYHFHLNIGEMYQDGKVMSKLVVGRDCLEQCPVSNTSVHAKKARLLPQLTASGKMLPPGNKMGRGINSERTEEEIKQDCITNRINVTLPDSEYEKETKEQTVRMMQNHLAPILMNQAATKVNLSEYSYYKRAFRVMQKVCPEEYVPSRLLTGINRMWKLLLWESHEMFPYTETKDEDQIKRIEDILTMCANNATKYEFHNSTQEPGVNAKCPVEIAEVNGPSYNHSLVNVNETLPEYLKFNVDKMDFVIETAWKVVLMAHYHCAKFFNGTGIDHSHMMNKLEALFNAKIMKRWVNSKGSYDVIKFVFRMYDLNKFAEGIDGCVAAARDLSEYQNWMLRPKVPVTSNDLSQERPKRSIENSLNKVMDDKGYCINEFLDPVTKLNYKLKVGCSVTEIL